MVFLIYSRQEIELRGKKTEVQEVAIVEEKLDAKNASSE